MIELWLLKKAIYKYDNGSGWDEIMFKTTADQVVEDSSRRFVSDTEKSTWNAKASTSGAYKQVTEIYVKVGGVYKKIVN